MHLRRGREGFSYVSGEPPEAVRSVPCIAKEKTGIQSVTVEQGRQVRLF